MGLVCKQVHSHINKVQGSEGKCQVKRKTMSAAKVQKVIPVYSSRLCSSCETAVLLSDHHLPLNYLPAARLLMLVLCNSSHFTVRAD